ncbi:MAG: T9SS type A sorting domain-containing protein [Ignavibacteriaceae bacterium]|nr:T9SS type A sorting domain-containing protein [Ignavibacteriaceae bacterium]
MNKFIQKMLLLTVLIVITGFGQIPYKMESGAGTFTPLTAGNPLVWLGTGLDDNYSDTVSLPFTFTYAGVDYTTFQVSTNGFLRLGSGLLSSVFTNALNGTVRSVLAPLWDDHKVDSINAITYEVSGSAPNRVVTVEWRTVYFPRLNTTPNAEFQVKLYENGNIEYIYGTMVQNTAGTPSASIGLSDNNPIAAANQASGTFLSINLGGVAGERVYHQSMGQEFNTVAQSPESNSKFTFSPDLGAPLAGVYNIPNVDFPTLSSMAMALNRRGISAAVTINVADGTYDDIFHLNNVAGTSETNTITFTKTGGEVTLSPRNGSANTTAPGAANGDAMVRLEGTQYFVLDGIRMTQNAGNISSATLKFNMGILVRNYILNRGVGDVTIIGSRFNTFKNFFIDLDASQGISTAGMVGVRIGTQGTSATDTLTANSYNTFQDFIVEDFWRAGFQFYNFVGTTNPGRYNRILGVNTRSQVRGVNITTGSSNDIRAIEINAERDLVVENVDIYDINSTIHTTNQLYGVWLNPANSATDPASGTTILRGLKIYNLATSGTVATTGLTVAIGLNRMDVGSTLIVENNSIYNIFNNGSTTGRAIGILANTGAASGTNNVIIANNYIYDLRAPRSTANTTTTGPGVVAMNLQSSAGPSAYYVYYNTMYLDDQVPPTSAAHQSAGIFWGNFASSFLYLNNNIIVNLMSTTTGRAMALNASSNANLLRLAQSSDNNMYFVGTPSATRLIAHDFTTGWQTLPAYVAAVATGGLGGPREASTFNENPPFTNPTANMTMSTTIPTQAEKGGLPLTTPLGLITKDYFGNNRNSDFPDIGAEEFAGTILDVTPPAISHTQLVNSGNTGTRNITAKIIDPSGVASGANAPAVYFKKGAEGTFIQSLSTGATGSEYSFAINQTLLPGGVSSGDTVFYYIAAQDNFSTPNGGTLPKGGSGINPPGSTPPSTYFSYLVTQAPLAGDYNIGVASFNRVTGRNIEAVLKTRTVMKDVEESVTEAFNEEKIEKEITGVSPLSTGRTVKKEVTEQYYEYYENGKLYTGPLGAENTYASISAAIADLNFRGISGHTRFLLLDTLYVEAGNFAGILYIDITNESKTSVDRTVTIKPATGVSSRIQINSANPVFYVANPYFHIDGSNTTNGTTRNLTLNNIGTGASSGVIAFVPGANNGSIKNTIGSSSLATVGYGILVSGANDVTVENNHVFRTVLGIQSQNSAMNTVIKNNYLGSDVLEDKLLSVGIAIISADNFTVEGNTVRGITRPTSAPIQGIQVGNSTGGILPSNGTISKNKISDINMTGSGTTAWAAIGIRISSSAPQSNIVIANNVITDLRCGGDNGSSFTNSGIRIEGSGGGYHIINNSINLFTDIPFVATGAISNAGIHITTSTVRNINLVNNIIVNNTTFSGAPTLGKAFVIYTLVGEVGYGTVDHNLYQNQSPNAVFSYLAGTDYDFMQWRNVFAGRDVYSLLGDPAFTDSLNLKPKTNDPNAWNSHGRGYPIAQITEDIDGVSRSTSIATGPSGIGAYEINPSVSPSFASSSGSHTTGGVVTYTQNGIVLGSVTFGNNGTVPDSSRLMYYPVYQAMTEGTNYAYSQWYLQFFGGTGYNYDVALFYSPATLGQADPANLKLGLDAGSGLTLTNGTVNQTTTTVTATGLSSGGTFQLLETFVNAPSNLMAMANTWRKIDLQWQDNSTDELGFILERKDGDSTSVNPYQIVTTLGPNVTSFIDTNNVGDQLTYTYRIKAVGALTESDWSNQAQVVSLIPVELNSFAASVDGKTIILNWTTGSERNNSGFEVQRKAGEEWVKLGFIDGMGSTAEKTDYTYTDKWDYQSFTGAVEYRLKQIDFDGTFEYSPVVSVEVDFRPTEYALYQNYPNPFNPSTVIKYALPFESKVKLTVYNITGEVIKVLVDEVQAVGFQSVDFQANQLSSGLYIYVIEASSVTGEKSYNSVKKMMLLK